MMLLVVGCSFRATPVELRERLVLDDPSLARALVELGSRYRCETVILGTCNRMELYLAWSGVASPSPGWGEGLE